MKTIKKISYKKQEKLFGKPFLASLEIVSESDEEGEAENE